jgi:hypothetical protein
MQKYSRGKIYKIIAPDNTSYIGSTIDTLVSRFGNHRRTYNSWKNGNVKRPCSVVKMFEEHGIKNCKIELVENFSCESKKELDRREGEIIKLTECINKVIAGRTGKEYRKDKKEELNEKSRSFYNKNRETELERNKVYYQKNSQARKNYSKNYEKLNPEKIKIRKQKWREANPDKVKEQKKKWREANRDKINARKRELRALAK